jgi:hypothetical protein
MKMSSAFSSLTESPPVQRRASRSGSIAFSGTVQTETTTAEWIFLKKIHFHRDRKVHSIPENALSAVYGTVITILPTCAFDSRYL